MTPHKYMKLLDERGSTYTVDSYETKRGSFIGPFDVLCHGKDWLQLAERGNRAWFVSMNKILEIRIKLEGR